MRASIPRQLACTGSDAGDNVPNGAMLHGRLFERALEHACSFRDRIADRPPRPVIPAGKLQALFDGPTPEASEDPVAVIDALNAAA